MNYHYNAYKPYWNEAKWVLIIDLAYIITFVSLSLLIVKNIVFQIVIALVPLLDMVFKSRYCFLSVIEKRLQLYQDCKLKLDYVVLDDSFLNQTGKWENLITKIYPKEYQANRYKLFFQKEHGHIVLNCTLGGKLRQSVYKKPPKTAEEAYMKADHIVYGKLTHIIVYWDCVAIRRSGLWERDEFELIHSPAVYKGLEIRNRFIGIDFLGKRK